MTNAWFICLDVQHAQTSITRETTDQFRLRGNNYKSNDRKFKRREPCMREYLLEHFYSDDHNGFLEAVAITLINKLSAEILKTGKTNG